MLRITLLVLLAYFSMAMGPKRPDIPSENGGGTTPSGLADPEPFQTQFKELGKAYGAIFIAEKVVFSFRSFFGSTIGMCISGSSRTNQVQYSTSAWRGGSNTFREMLSFHELGHCLLGRGHKNSNHSDGRPESVMKSSIFNEKTYLAHRDEYLKELFSAGSRARFDVSLESEPHDFGDCRFGR